jgi:hypothetical protein
MKQDYQIAEVGDQFDTTELAELLAGRARSCCPWWS